MSGKIFSPEPLVEQSVEGIDADVTAGYNESRCGQKPTVKADDRFTSDLSDHPFSPLDRFGIGSPGKNSPSGRGLCRPVRLRVKAPESGNVLCPLPLDLLGVEVRPKEHVGKEVCPLFEESVERAEFENERVVPGLGAEIGTEVLDILRKADRITISCAGREESGGEVGKSGGGPVFAGTGLQDEADRDPGEGGVRYNVEGEAVGELPGMPRQGAWCRNRRYYWTWSNRLAWFMESAQPLGTGVRKLPAESGARGYRVW